MTLTKVRLLRLFAWVIGVGMITIIMISVHDLASNQRLRLKAITEGGRKYRDSLRGLADFNESSGDTKDDLVPPGATEMVRLPPATHVGFLKVHKAASTTTQAIFLRFGWRRNLTFVLPPEYNKFGYPNIISTNESITRYNILPPPQGRAFDILCHHVVYGRENWYEILPPDSKFVGTVREPFSHFKSVMDYFNPRSVANIEEFIDRVDPVGTFLKNPTKYESPNVRYSFMNNRLSFEYGVDPEIILRKDFAAFDTYLHEVLDKDFSVVIVAEMFDESLIIMRRKLNWELEDIMYALKNVRNSAKAHRYTTTDEHKILHKNYSSFDYILYSFFKEKLLRQIQEEGESFQQELDYFRDTRKYIENFCHVVPRRVHAIRVDKSQWTEGFDVTRQDCEIMHKGEIAFTQMIRLAQYGSATWKGIGTVPRVKVVSKRIT